MFVEVPRQKAPRDDNVEAPRDDNVEDPRDDNVEEPHSDNGKPIRMTTNGKI